MPSALTLEGRTLREPCHRPAAPRRKEREHTLSRLNHCVLLSAQAHWASELIPVAVELSRTFHMCPCRQIPHLQSPGRPALGPPGGTSVNLTVSGVRISAGP